jgi:2-methylcitrate dehydratase PrpD
LALAINPAHYKTGWHSTSTLIAVGAAAAVGRVLGLEKDQMTHCLGIAASQVSGLRVNFGTPTKPLHVASAARDAIDAAELAARGWTSSPDSFDDPDIGFLEVMSRGSIRRDVSHLPGWRLTEVGLQFKRFPSCGLTHCAIEAALDCRRELGGFIPKSRLEIRVHPAVLDVVRYPNPKTPLEAKFSLNYCAALAWVKGQVTTGDFTDDGFTGNDAVLEFAATRTIVVPDETIALSDEFPVVNVTLLTCSSSQGRYHTEARVPVGHVTRPFSQQDLTQKFSQCIGMPAGDAAFARVSATLLGMVDEPAVRPAMKRVRKALGGVNY